MSMEHEILKVINQYYDKAATSCCFRCRDDLKAAAFTQILGIVENYIRRECPDE